MIVYVDSIIILLDLLNYTLLDRFFMYLLIQITFWEAFLFSERGSN